ncbi:alpha/beta hydrolase-fold protein [Streptomyces sp. NPDC049585]|uniref:alpha/beta hydrolase n=1 Tax=Streptomyces sp. NPDC049585 TaxID=3155154 RepID=UPI003429B10B
MPLSRRRRRLWLVAPLVVLALVAWPVLNFFDVFSDKGDPVDFGKGGGKGAAGTLMPTGPQADFRVENTLGDGTKIARTTLHGKKSGFTGDVWVWAPEQYKDAKYANSGFPVLIALPGGAGYPRNYWMGTNLKLQSSIAQWSKEGKSLPFIVVMPVLNPENHDEDPKDPKLGRYWDGSDIPGQPKMGTWLTEDVPDLVKANFRTLTSRDGWAFMGSSTGGFAGLKSVLKNPDKFKAVIASGPDIVPDSLLWNGHEKEKQENNPEKLAPQLVARKGPDVYLAFQVGTKEKKAMAAAKKFIASYGNKGPVHTMLREIPDGEHNAATYVPSMGEGPIQWISQHMQGPTPAP